MKFFIDTAVLDEIRAAIKLGILDGVTTNPSLMAKIGVRGEKNCRDHYAKICEIVDDNVSAEVIATDYEGMMTEAKELVSISKKIVVKIPLIESGIRAIRSLSDEGIRTNCTLCFSGNQALIAAKAGATYISPFIGRLDDVSDGSGIDLIKQILLIYRNYGYKTQVLAASIRHVAHVLKCAEAGADVATIPLNVIRDMLKHPLTDSGLAKFLADAKVV